MRAWRGRCAGHFFVPERRCRRGGRDPFEVIHVPQIELHRGRRLSCRSGRRTRGFLGNPHLRVRQGLLVVLVTTGKPPIDRFEPRRSIDIPTLFQEVARLQIPRIDPKSCAKRFDRFVAFPAADMGLAEQAIDGADRRRTLRLRNHLDSDFVVSSEREQGLPQKQADFDLVWLRQKNTAARPNRILIFAFGDQSFRSRDDFMCGCAQTAATLPESAPEIANLRAQIVPALETRLNEASPNATDLNPSIYARDEFCKSCVSDSKVGSRRTETDRFGKRAAE